MSMVRLTTSARARSGDSTTLRREPPRCASTSRPIAAASTSAATIVTTIPATLRTGGVGATTRASGGDGSGSAGVRSVAALLGRGQGVAGHVGHDPGLGAHANTGDDRQVVGGDAGQPAAMRVEGLALQLDVPVDPVQAKEREH